MRTALTKVSAIAVWFKVPRERGDASFSAPQESYFHWLVAMYQNEVPAI